MWSVTLTGNGEYVADRRMRELGRRLCDECPLQPKCLADALTAPPARDWNITGGLTYRERLMLAQRAAEHFGVPPGDLQQVPAARVETWIATDASVIETARGDLRAYWRDSWDKRRESGKDNGETAGAFHPRQGTLF